MPCGLNGKHGTVVPKQLWIHKFMGYPGNITSGQLESLWGMWLVHYGIMMYTSFMIVMFHVFSGTVDSCHS